MDLEIPKTEKNSPEASADEDFDWIDLEEEIPLNWEAREEKRKQEKAQLYKIQMAIKESQRPKCNYVCPEEECKFTSSREEKIPFHVLSHHGRQILREELAQLERHRIIVGQEKEKEKQKANKIKQEQKEKEEKVQKQMKDLQETLKKVEEEALKLKETHKEKIEKEAEKEKEAKIKKRKQKRTNPKGTQT
jgi:hypothetical protein